MKQNGFNLVELMVTIAVLAILLTITAPSLSDMLERRQLRGAAESIYAHLYYARMEALKKNRKIFVSFSSGDNGAWCFGLDDTAACDCNTPNDCQIDSIGKVTSGVNYPVVDFSQTFGGKTNFEPRRGTANNGTATFRIASGEQKNIVVSSLGRVRYED